MSFYNPVTYRGPIKLAVFDWAGTTVDYGCCAPAAVFIEGYRHKGVAITLAEARAPMGIEKRAHIAAIAQMPAVVARWQTVHGRSITEQDIDEMYAIFAPLLLQTLVPGVLMMQEWLRQQGIKIGATTGYFTEAAQVVQRAAAAQGYHPDSTVCASDVSAGRPAPWMLYRVMNELEVYPPAAVIAIGDTVADVAAGRNAGVWTVGVAKTGNELGLTAAEVVALPADELQHRLTAAYLHLSRAGAHYVVNGVGDLPWVIDKIQSRLARGERP
jgi:phosphonoacetaldehyde hydrolase